MSFYHFSQNNSGGGFDYDPERGITHHVVIEADSAEEANRKAVYIGLYFNGCDDGIDCSCCGDRWSEQWLNDGTEEPTIYGEPIETWDPENGAFGLRWIDGYEAFVHYKDGTIKGFANSPPKKTRTRKK